MSILLFFMGNNSHKLNHVYRANRCKIYVYFPGYTTPIECKTNVVVHLKKCYKKENEFLWKEVDELDYILIERCQVIDEKMVQLAKDTRMLYRCGRYIMDEMWKYEVHFYFVPFQGVVNYRAIGCLMSGIDEKYYDFKAGIVGPTERHSNKD